MVYHKRNRTSAKMLLVQLHFHITLIVGNRSSARWFNCVGFV
jgi:hypothetical protein